MKTLKLFSMAALVLVMAACSSDDNEIQQPSQQGPMKFTATLAAPNSGTTRTTATAGTGGDAGKFLVTWAVDDKIALVYEDANGDRQKVEANVDDVDGSGNATISATLPTAVKDGTSVTLVYPYAILDESDGADHDFMTNKEYTSKRDYFSTQTGAAPTDANGLPKFDWRDGSGTFSVGGSGVTLSSNVTMYSNIAIWKLNLENQINDPLAASELIINCGPTLFGFNISPAASEVYLYMPLPYYNFLKVAFTGKPLEILAVIKGSNYSYSHSAVDLTEGKIYNSTVTLANLWEGNVENSSGNGTSIKYCAGETWAQAIANHSSNQDDGWSIENSHVHHSFYGDLKNDADAYVDPTSTVTPGNTYKWTNF